MSFWDGMAAHGPYDAILINAGLESLPEPLALQLASGGRVLAPLGQPGGPLAPIDRRLKLAPCPQTPTVETPQMNAATVACPSLGWRIRVPVQQSQEEVAVRAASTPAVRQVRADPTIRRGDPVALVVVTGGFTVSRQAIAEQDGSPGDRIRVRTEPRAAPIIGQVMSDGRVSLGF